MAKEEKPPVSREMHSSGGGERRGRKQTGVALWLFLRFTDIPFSVPGAGDNPTRQRHDFDRLNPIRPQAKDPAPLRAVHTTNFPACCVGSGIFSRRAPTLTRRWSPQMARA